MKNKIAVIGSGISGLSAARMLKDIGHDVVVFEKSNQIGGLIKCTTEQGVLFHRVGGHVFNTKIKKVEDWFWKQFDKQQAFILAKRNAKIWMEDQYIGYPIENHLYQFDHSITNQIISELLLNVNNERIEINNFEDFLRVNFGKTLYELYFKPYNYKIWHTDLSQVPLPWLDGKLPMPMVQDVIMTNIYKADEKNMVHSNFFYPKSGGSSYIADTLAKSINIEKGVEISSITINNDKWVINGQLFNSVIFTGDVRTLNRILNVEDQEIKNNCSKVKSLLSNGTSNALCYVDDSDLSWLYLPEYNTDSHRIIFTGNFSSTNNSANKRLTCTVEFSGILSVEEMKQTLSILPGNLEPIAFNQEPNSYVIQQHDTRILISNLKNTLQSKRFYLLGRFAEWEYYNMDKAIEAAINLVEKNF